MSASQGTGQDIKTSLCAIEYPSSMACRTNFRSSFNEFVVRCSYWCQRALTPSLVFVAELSQGCKVIIGNNPLVGHSGPTSGSLCTTNNNLRCRGTSSSSTIFRLTRLCAAQTSCLLVRLFGLLRTRLVLSPTTTLDRHRRQLTRLSVHNGFCS